MPSDDEAIPDTITGISERFEPELWHKPLIAERRREA
jgi:hypothetical protein